MALKIPKLQKFVLRPYQTKALDEAHRLYHEEEKNRLLIVMATGLGKTVVFARSPDKFDNLAKYGMLVLVHRKELITQAVHKIQSAHPSLVVGVEQAGKRATRNADVVVASVQTLGRSVPGGGPNERLKKFAGRFGIIVVDEAHHIKEDGSYANVLNFFGVGDDPTNSDMLADGMRRLLLGVTATPNRSDGLGLHKFFDEIVVNFNLVWGVKNGYLTDIRAWKVTTGIDISTVKTKAGDFEQSQLGGLINNSRRNSQIVSAWKQYSQRRFIAFAGSVEHAHELASVFVDAGFPVRVVDGTTPQEIRDEYYEELRKGDIHGLINFGVLTEGFDAPWVEAILMVRPTKSTVLYMQMLGRGTRTLPDVDLSSDNVEVRLANIADSDKKFMTVIDFVDVVGKHDIVTAPTLIGMNPEFDGKGSRLISEIKEEIERIENENPFKDIRDASDFEEIEMRLESINVWDMTRMAEEVKEYTNLRWFQPRPEEFQIEVPAAARDREAYPDPEDRRRFFVQIKPDTLGRYTAAVVKPPAWIDGKHHPEKVIMSTSVKPSWQEAVNATDQWIQKNYGDVAGLMEHSPKWGTQLASENQITLLNKMKVPLMQKDGAYIDIDTGKPLTKGRASALISAKKIERQGR